MKLFLSFDEEVMKRFPQLAVSLGTIKNVEVEPANDESGKLRGLVFDKVRSTFRPEELKDNLIVRAYRDLFWALGVDPTKTRPSGEALLRRVLNRKDIPHISSAVDAYNFASLETIVPISGFDLDAITPPLHVRFSRKNNMFQGIGMQNPTQLEENLLLVVDSRQILSIYPHKDADATKITGKTKNILLVGYGAPGISKDKLVEAVELALSYVHQTSAGEIERVEVFSAVS